MSQRVTTKRVASEKDHVDRHHDSSDTNTKTISELRRDDRVVAENHDEQQREVEKVSMDVLEDQRKLSLAAIIVSRLTDRTCRRIRPKCFVVRAAIVITGEPKSARSPKDQKRRRDRQDDIRHPRLPRT